MRMPSLEEVRGFVGKRAIAAGGGVVAASLGIFVLDLALASGLQRFFAACGLTVVPIFPPLGIPLATPLTEGAALATIGLVRAGLLWLAGILAGRCHVTLEVERREAITRWALGTGNAALGRVMTLYNDAAIGSAAAISNIFALCGRVVLLLGVFVALLWYSLAVTLAVLVVLALIAPLYVRLEEQVKRSSYSIQATLATAIDRTSAAVKNGLFLRIHGIAGVEARCIGASTSEYAAGSLRFYSVSSLRAVLPQMIGLLVVVAIATKGGVWLGDDKSRLVAYLFLVFRLFQNLSDFARVRGNLLLNWPRLRTMWFWWHNEFETTRRSVDFQLDDSAAGPRVEKPVGWRGTDVSFAWDAKEPTAIDRLEINIPEGKLLVVTGPSGAGKTSLILLLAGLVEPTSGRIELTGPELAGSTPVKARQRLLRSISYVGPDPFVVPGTIRDQLTFGLSSAPDDASLRVALALAQCDFVQKLALGLDHRVSEQGGGLSAGQKQRLALARALLRRPTVLFLDEATSNLDADTEAAVVRTISALKGGMTIVAVTHRDAMLAIADRVLVLGDNTRALSVATNP